VRLLTWAIRLALFVLLIAFAAKNVAPVRLQFYFNHALEAPLVLWLLGFFALGALFGVAAMLSTVLRQRRELSALKRGVQPPAAPPLFPIP